MSERSASDLYSGFLWYFSLAGVLRRHISIYRVVAVKCLSDALMMVFTGKARHSAYSFISQLLMPPGPAAFAGLRLDNNLKDLSSDISKKLRIVPKRQWA